MTSTPQSGHDGPYAAPIRIAELTVLPEWIDYNGHMNARYYGFAFQDQAEHFLERDLGFGASYVKEEGMGPFVLQKNIGYMQEMVQGEPFHITMRLLDHDAKRMHFYFQMISNRSGKICASAEYLNMNINLEHRKPAPFPDWLKARLEQMQSDHASLERPANVGAPIGIRRK